MSEGYLTLAKCIECGKTFEYMKKTRTRSVCEKCRDERAYRLQREAHARRRTENSKTKPKVKCQTVIPELIPQEVVYSQAEREENLLNLPDIGDLVSLAREYGSIRYRFIQLIEKDRAVYENCSKIEIDLLHEIENLSEVTTNSVDLLVKLKKNREKRRVYKQRAWIEKGILDSMLIKNPSEYVAKAVQNAKDFEYNERADEEMEEQL